MKVVCIDDVCHHATPQAPWLLKKDVVYEVINHHVHWGGLVYELSIQPGVGYWPEYFAPLPDIDETELVKERAEKEGVGV